MNYSKRILGFWFFYFGFLISFSIAPTWSIAQSSVPPPESSALKEIETLYTKGSTNEAQEHIDSFLAAFPQSTLIPSVQNVQGLLWIKQKRPLDAIDQFKKAVAGQPKQTKYNQYILYNLATAQYEAGQFQEAHQTAQILKLDLLDSDTRFKALHLKASIALKASPPDKTKPLSPPPPLVPNPAAPPLDAAVSIPAGMAPTSVEEAPELKDQASINPKAIGVLLPLTGKFARFGMKSLQAIQLAFGIKDNPVPSATPSPAVPANTFVGDSATLIVEDSGETVEQAIKALDRLVLQKGVIAVIGPMVTKGIDNVAQRAQALKIPMISLARRAGASRYDSVFQGGLTQQLQASEIAKHAIQILGMRRFAIAYPNDKLGVALANGFWDEVESLNGKIVGVEGYSLDQTDFRAVVDRLSGLYYTEARPNELQALAKEREVNHVTKRSRKTEQFYHLKPLVDYDAVFIADDASTAGLIIPTFSYRDVEGMKFLGNSSWNTPDFITRTQGYSESAFFVDAFNPKAPSPLAKNFIDRFKTAYGQEPSSLEALAYDAGSILQSFLAASSSGLSRSRIKDKIQDLKGYEGVTGSITVKDGNFLRTLKVLTVKGGQVTEVASAPAR